jgi:hypothetical protein
MLRTVCKESIIGYLVGVARTGSAAALTDLRVDLTFGQRPADYAFQVIETLFLPRGRGTSKTPWDHELDFLTNRRQELNAELVQRRIDLLAGARAEGMRDAAFWPRADGRQMRLRPGFALLPFDYDPVTVSAADVYLAVRVALSLALGRAEGVSGPTGSRVRRVLAPRCFDRFNDGIVQSALLRACAPIELDYSSDVTFSEEMLAIFQFICENANADAGEAASEFALAVASGRLKFDQSHEARALEMMSGCSSDAVRSLAKLWERS